MARAIKALLAVMFFQAAAYAGCPRHPNLILCWDTQEGQGTVAHDSSGLAFDGTLTGGPAWILAQAPKVIFSTYAGVNMGSYAISYPGTNGVETKTANTSAFDFSSNKPYSVGISIQLSTLDAVFRGIVSYDDSAVSMGWHLQRDNGGTLVLYHLGSAGVNFGNIPDLNPHRIFWSRNATTVFFYLDGKPFPSSPQAIGDMISSGGATYLGIGKQSNVSANVYNGKAGNLVVYNFCPASKDQIDAFAFNDYVQFQGTKSVEEDQ